ncbi:MAG: pectinesterase family protein [Alistipes shahii]|uniref:pectinesterase family protein n=1 Tax=Alistipes shahii TaxID=328814 RepID=UPI00399D3758
MKLTWDNYAKRKPDPPGGLGTPGSSTVYFGGDGWTVRNIAFENTAGRVGQAVAVQCLGTGLHFIGCRFLGNRDTLYLYGVGNRDGRALRRMPASVSTTATSRGRPISSSAPAAALFRPLCEIRSKADSYITAASTCRGQACGLIFEGAA